MIDSNNQNHNFNHEANNYRFNDGGDDFRLETTEEEDSSPPLWRFTNNNPGALSPASRALAIARGQREIMEMVENMPETSYELSLKDMVDQRMEQEEGKKGRVKREESSSNKRGRIMIVKNGSMNHNKGLVIINFFFPFSIGAKIRKSGSRSTSISNFEKSSSRDQWWKKYTGSSDSSSLRSNSDRTRSGYKNGCWSFLPSRKKKMIMSNSDHEGF